MNRIKAENKGIDEGLFRVLCTAFNRNPSHQTMGMNLIYLGQGSAGIKMTVGHEFTTVKGRLHGGIVATLADTVMGWTVLSLGHAPMTVDNYVNYLAPAFEELELTAEGYVINAGNTLIVVEASVLNNEGKLIVKSRGTFIRDNKTSIPSSI